MNKNNDNKLVPKLRFPEFLKNKEWLDDELGELSSFFKGKGLVKSDIATEGINPCVHYGELFTKYNEVIKEIKSYTNISEGFKSEANDVLMPTSDVTPNGLAKASCIKLDNIILGGEILVIRPKSNIYGEFLSRFIRHREREVLKLVSGTTVFHLYGSSFEKFRLIYPSIEEQQKIASCLSSLDKVITAERKKLELLKEHKKGLLQNLFPKKEETLPKLRFPEFQNIEVWKQNQLREIGEFIGGGTPDTSVQEYWDGEIQWFTPTEIKEKNIKKSIRTITQKGLQNSSAKLLPKGALLITTRATIGDVGIAIEECSTNQGFQSLVVNDTENNLFWYYWITHHKSELKRRSSGSTFSEIGKNELIKITAYSPKKKEQQKIAACLSSLDDLINAQNKKLESLQLHKKGLLQGLFPNVNDKI